MVVSLFACFSEGVGRRADSTVQGIELHAVHGMLCL